MLINYANPDMVGHTGVFEAAVKAVETVDTCVGRIVDAVLELGGALLITADHGNAEELLDENSKPQTAHTTNLVEFLVVSDRGKDLQVKEGILADVAPTVLKLMGMPQPEEMTGTALVD